MPVVRSFTLQQRMRDLLVVQFGSGDRLRAPSRVEHVAVSPSGLGRPDINHQEALGHHLEHPAQRASNRRLLQYPPECSCIHHQPQVGLAAEVNAGNANCVVICACAEPAGDGTSASILRARQIRRSACSGALTAVSSASAAIVRSESRTRSNQARPIISSRGRLRKHARSHRHALHVVRFVQGKADVGEAFKQGFDARQGGT